MVYVIMVASTVLRVGLVTIETDGEVVLPTEEGGTIAVKPIQTPVRTQTSPSTDANDVFAYSRVVKNPHEFILSSSWMWSKEATTSSCSTGTLVLSTARRWVTCTLAAM